MLDQNKEGKLKLLGIRLVNFRSCSIFPENGSYLEIDKFTTLIGKNDVGKSNILAAIDVVCNNKGLSTGELHKGRTDNCEISLILEVPEELRDNLEELNQYAGSSQVEVKKTFEFSNEKLKGTYSLDGSKINYKNLSKYLPTVLFIPAVKSVEDELKFGRNTLTSELFTPIIEKTSEEKSQTESVNDLKDRLKLCNSDRDSRNQRFSAARAFKDVE